MDSYNKKNGTDDNNWNNISVIAEMAGREGECGFGDLNEKLKQYVRDVLDSEGKLFIQEFLMMIEEKRENQDSEDTEFTI